MTQGPSSAIQDIKTLALHRIPERSYGNGFGPDKVEIEALDLLNLQRRGYNGGKSTPVSERLKAIWGNDLDVILDRAIADGRINDIELSAYLR